MNYDPAVTGVMQSYPSMLNDAQIAQELGHKLDIAPYHSDQLQPVSYDLTLAKDIRRPDPKIVSVDLRDPQHEDREYGYTGTEEEYTTGHTITRGGYSLRPGEFILGCTQEIISLSPHLAGRVEGKSSLGRVGLAVHITAGFIDPGFRGQITLEIVNLAPYSIVLYPEMPIAQIVFMPVDKPEKDYSETGHYQNQMGPTPSTYRFKG